MRELKTLTSRIAELLDRYSGWFILTTGIVTLLLIIPMIKMSPGESASDNPGGQVYDVFDQMNVTLPPRIHSAGFIVEARDGDILTQAPLFELYKNSQKNQSNNYPFQRKDRTGMLRNRSVTLTEVPGEAA